MGSRGCTVSPSALFRDVQAVQSLAVPTDDALAARNSIVSFACVKTGVVWMDPHHSHEPLPILLAHTEVSARRLFVGSLCPFLGELSQQGIRSYSTRLKA
jgi:hypothetical protein